MAKREPLQDVGLTLHQYIDSFMEVAGQCKTLKLEVNVMLFYNVVVHTFCYYHSPYVYVDGTCVLTCYNVAQ